MFKEFLRGFFFQYIYEIELFATASHWMFALPLILAAGILIYFDQQTDPFAVAFVLLWAALWLLKPVAMILHRLNKKAGLDTRIEEG